MYAFNPILEPIWTIISVILELIPFRANFEWHDLTRVVIALPESLTSFLSVVHFIILFILLKLSNYSENLTAPELKLVSLISLEDSSSSIIGGSKELATERFSMVTSEGAGAALGRISPTGGEHLAGPEVHPTQLQET